MKKLLIAATLVAAFAASALKPAELVYTDASTLPLLGTVAPDAEKAYSRLPDSLNGRVRDDLWRLGLNSAGLSVRFASDASTIGVKWKAMNKFNMNHMTPTGIRGVDLYVMLDDSTWTTLGAGRPVQNDHNTATIIGTDMTPRMREYMLYLPLYDGIDSLYIGVDSAAVVTAPRVDLPRRSKPLVMYGSSILQGGCASRPGLVHTSILERMLQREVINFGFSGNAKLDPEIAELMAGIDASVFVLDALPNCTTPMVDTLLVPFVKKIRSAHPTTPIVLVESELFPIMLFNNEVQQTVTEKNATLRRIYDELAATDPNLYYFRGEDILGTDLEAREYTVDNYHMTDPGFMAFARHMYPLLKELMDKSDTNQQ